MTSEELKEQKAALKSVYESNEKKLIREFCDSNNPYKIGDIFTDHIGIIKIEQIGYDYSSINGTPCCIYKGSILNKDLTPTKKKEKTRTAYQLHEKKS